MTRPKLRMLNPAARVRAVGLGAPVRVLGAVPAVKVALQFYASVEWRALVRRIVKARGRQCQDINCQTPNRGHGGRVYADHVHELRDGGAPLDERNVMLMCPSCHGRKTARAREARAAREARVDRLMLQRSTGRGSPKAPRDANAAQGASLESAPNRPTLFSPGDRR